MPFSIDNFRRLNKAVLLAVAIDEPEGAGWSGNGKKGPWKVELYTEGNLALSGQVQHTDGLGGSLNNLLNGPVAKLAMGGLQMRYGVAPQLDYAKKFLYAGVDSLNLPITGYLVLESDPREDYLTPLDKLAYLTFPSRGPEVGSVLKGGVNKILSGLGIEKDVFSNVQGWIGNIYNAVRSVWDDKYKDKSNEDGWNEIVQEFNNAIGAVYTMKVPPTFDIKTQGSGLDLRYGKTLISDVFITSLRVDIPELYYEGGWPPYMKVDLQLETCRPTTASMFSNMVNTIPHNMTSTGIPGEKK